MKKSIPPADLLQRYITNTCTEEERRAEGHEIDDDERALMAQALSENSVIVAQMTPFFETDDAAKG